MGCLILAWIIAFLFVVLLSVAKTANDYRAAAHSGIEGMRRLQERGDDWRDKYFEADAKLAQFARRQS